MSLPRFEVHQPRTLDEVISLLQRDAKDTALLAGGTALLNDMRHGARHPGHLVSLWEVPGLTGVDSNGAVHVGALTTISVLADSLSGQAPLDGLREASWAVGGPQVRNVATVGGNICQASPGADMVPSLLCLDAELTLVGPEGERSARLDGFLTGPDLTAIGPAEVLTRIRIPRLPPATGTGFVKVMRRQAVDCSIVAAAARVTLSPDGRSCLEARISVGAAAPNPFRARRSEALLVERGVDPETLREAGRLARDDSRPITDVRASADYRRMLVESLVERVLRTACRRARGGGADA